MSLLQLLDRGFSTRFVRSELSALAPTAVTTLFDKGILSMAPDPDVVTCPLGPHEGSGHVSVTKDSDGMFTGFCEEHGKKVRIPAQDAEWVLFDREKWCKALRDRNGLIDEAIISASGMMFAGTYRTNNRKVGIVIVSSQAQGSPKDFQPRTVERIDHLCVMLDDSQPTQEEHRSYMPSAIAFEEDMITLKGTALGTAIANLQRPSQETEYLQYTEGSSTPLPLSGTDYDRITSTSAVKDYQLIIDLAGGSAWRSGRKISRMAQKKKKGRKSILSPTGLKLIAEYLRRPRAPLPPYRIGPYLGAADSREKKSAQVMLLNMCKTLSLEGILNFTDNPTGLAGDGLYKFNPDSSFRYLLISTADTA